MLDLSEAVNLAERTVQGAVFSDPEVYQAELRRIFGHAWLYVAHASQLAKIGDFVSANMGLDGVVVCRGKDNRVRVFLNSCPHKGARFCRQEHGNTRSFVCPYHVRTYETSGALIGIAGAKLADLDQNADHTGLIEVARVEEFEGLVFANFDPNCISLVEYLGDLAWYLRVVLAEASSARVLFEGLHRWTFDANWKFPAEQSSGDPNHLRGFEQSLAQLGLGASSDSPQDFVARFEHGHRLLNLRAPVPASPTPFRQALLAEAKVQLSAEQAELLGGVHVATVFPNFEIISYPGFLNVRVFQPVGPSKTEVWSWGIAPVGAPPEYLNASRSLLSRYFSPTGVLEQNVVETWEECARGLAGAERGHHPLAYGRAAEPRATAPQGPGKVSPVPSERANFEFFEAWLSLMTADPR